MNNHETIEDHWKYNCEDCVRTLEIADAEVLLIKQLKLEGPEALQQSMFYPVLRAMQLGIHIDREKQKQMAAELQREIEKREAYLLNVLGHPLNPRSPLQMTNLFVHDLAQPPIKSRTTGNTTMDDDAMTRMGNREPLLRPLFKAISELRTLGVFLSTFVNATLDIDGRMRCAYNICGTETFRLSSRENAFDTGTNLQNIPKGHIAKEVEDLTLPNVRTLFIPDSGYTFFDMDLDRADLYVVVWECEDDELKHALRLGIDMHLMNACSIFNIKGIPYDELVEAHPNYKNHRERIGEDKRQKAKQGVHATNYGVKGRTLSQHLGSSVHEADKFIESWLAAHPGIKKWHERTNHQIQTRRFVENRYGYRRIYFDRPDSILPEALAWVPQSTVAITINKIWLKIYQTLPDVQVLLQVHDSIAGQFPSDQPSYVEKIRAAAQINIPYADPLTIPVGIKTSATSWGDCK